MPEVTGYEVLCRLKSQAATRDIPVIMISALDDLDSIVRCIEAGAVDYLPKPFDPTLLNARIGATLENKFLRDREQLMLAEIKREKERSEGLLLSILPPQIVDRINGGATMIADDVGEATILFADIVNFTPLAGRVPAGQPNRVPRHDFHGIRRAGGAPCRREDQDNRRRLYGGAGIAGGAAGPSRGSGRRWRVRCWTRSKQIANDTSVPIALRIGIHTGPAIAGVIGRKKFSLRCLGQHGEHREPDGNARAGWQNSRQPGRGPSPRRSLSSRGPRRDRGQGLRPHAHFFSRATGHGRMYTCPVTLAARNQECGDGRQHEPRVACCRGISTVLGCGRSVVRRASGGLGADPSGGDDRSGRNRGRRRSDGAGDPRHHCQAQADAAADDGRQQIRWCRRRRLPRC